MIGRLALAAALVMAATPALPHDIYTGVRGKDSQLCCGGSDCAATVYRERGGRTLPFVFKSEAESIPTIEARVDAKATIHADEATDRKSVV